MDILTAYGEPALIAVVAGLAGVYAANQLLFPNRLTIQLQDAALFALIPIVLGLYFVLPAYGVEGLVVSSALGGGLFLSLRYMLPV